jgi:hypothetical protein
LSIVTVPIRDAGDRRHAQREYVRVILNDFVLNPGPNDLPLSPLAADSSVDYGLMTPFVRRWQGRLAESLASAAGKHVQIPAGNEELRRILDTG